MNDLGDILKDLGDILDDPNAGKDWSMILVNKFLNCLGTDYLCVSPCMNVMNMELYQTSGFFDILIIQDDPNAGQDNNFRNLPSIILILLGS